MLAMSLHASPGVYALLVGSGISRSSGVGTGWDTTKALATRHAAVVLGADPGADFDVEQWWAIEYPDVELGYSTVFATSGLTQADRRKLLEPFFVPTEDDLAAGRKAPAPGHHAIARLVKRGTVRVIVTTNFDDLIEKALDAIGAPYQVIASPEAISGSEPLCHSACTVIKVHGDYKRIDVLNTAEELEQYHKDLGGLLDRVFDDYGLITCGWSADWDRPRRRHHPRTVAPLPPVLDRPRPGRREGIRADQGPKGCYGATSRTPKASLIWPTASRSSTAWPTRL